jgi:hypothetical protein
MLHEVTPDETCRAGDKSFHVRLRKEERTLRIRKEI